ncbi:hypothetical protein [Saccharopolyspora antimicrobica]|uniref:hypothetical protein n=1 Tax=Saccharopolyspora antimicrobica TaxID=455193 RepID=UPI001160220A|nr:hypothetical protein [Saccharopolyspora antimicrobica]
MSVVWVVVIGVAALAVGACAGLAWSFRDTRGRHGAYLPAFSAFAVIARVRGVDDAEPEKSMPYFNCEDEQESLSADQEVTERLYTVHAVALDEVSNVDGPASYSYGLIRASAPDEEEPEIEWPGPDSEADSPQVPSRQRALWIPAVSEESTGRHVLRETGRYALGRSWAS